MSPGPVLLWRHWHRARRRWNCSDRRPRWRRLGAWVEDRWRLLHDTCRRRLDRGPRRCRRRLGHPWRSGWRMEGRRRVLPDRRWWWLLRDSRWLDRQRLLCDGRGRSFGLLRGHRWCCIDRQRALPDGLGRCLPAWWCLDRQSRSGDGESRGLRLCDVRGRGLELWWRTREQGVRRWGLLHRSCVIACRWWFVPWWLLLRCGEWRLRLRLRWRHLDCRWRLRLRWLHLDCRLRRLHRAY